MDSNKSNLPIYSALATKALAELAELKFLAPFPDDASYRRLVALSSQLPPTSLAEYHFLLGRAHDNTKSLRFDPTIARSHYEKAVAIGPMDESNIMSGAPAAAYALGYHWSQGTFGRKDRAAAIELLSKAHECGHPAAALPLYDLMEGDDRFFSDKEWGARAIRILREAALSGSYPAKLRWAKLGAAEADVETSIRYYQELAVGDPQGVLRVRPQIEAALCLGLRHLIGANVDEDWSLARSYFERAIAAGQGHASLEQWINPASKLLRSILTLKNPDPLVSRLMDDLHKGRINADEAVRRIESGELPATDELLERLWAAGVLADLENSVPVSWGYILLHAEAVNLGGTIAMAHASHNDYGPTYNKRNQRRNNPMLGELAHGGLTGGMGELCEVKAQPNGEIFFSFKSPRRDLGPMLCAEDINVALALVFGPLQIAQTTPGLSIEPIYSKSTGRPYMMSEKVWFPSWLGHTLYGKTLYALDVLAGGIVSQPRSYVGEGSSLRADNNASPGALRMVELFHNAGGEVAGIYGRIMVHGAQLYRTWHVDADGGQRCSVHHMSMALLGANISEAPDGTQDRSVNVNNDRYWAGRIANVFTKEFESLALMMPVFERGRQLIALTEVLKELKQRGFEPSSTLRNRIQSTVRQLTERPALAIAERLVL